ncbi:MAG: ATP synthase F1 subunit gamma [Planctomycetota bacterium]|nr:MAG: ATP synthase F1 subunit gamma [Planctomycetota bacterium]
MGKSREIKKRMKAVGNIRRITRTMQMIATSKYSKAQTKATASKPYTTALYELVGELASKTGPDAHPLLAGGESKSGREITLVITSDRGLCGPYNGNIIRTAMRHLREHAPAANGRIEVVGKKGATVLRFNKFDLACHHTHFGDNPRYEDVERLAQDYIDRFTAGEVDAVRVVYMRYISAGQQRPEVLQLVPFDHSNVTSTESTSGGPSALYEFSPSAEELLGTLLPAAVKAVLYQCFNDAIVSEHVARMVAMKSATDNAGKMRKRLQRQYNRARQAQITTELTEIISGAAALE